MHQKVLEKTEEMIEKVVEQGIDAGNNLEVLDKLVDIHKDIKEELCMYNDYGRYEAYDAYGRDSYGRERYGRRGYDTKYRGEGKLDDMYMNYREYSARKEEYGRSNNYGAKEDSVKKLKYMLEDAVDFFKMLKEDAKSPEEMSLLREYIRKITEV